MQSLPLRQRSQRMHEIQRRHRQMVLARHKIASSRSTFAAVVHCTRSSNRSGAGDVAAKLFRALAVCRMAERRRVQAEAIDVGGLGQPRRRRARHRTRANVSAANQ